MQSSDFAHQDLYKRELFAVGLRKDKKAQILKLKRKVLFSSKDSSDRFFAGKTTSKIESEEELNSCLASLPELCARRDP